jgi:pimeloyl-ACP methyl ester carboxylesterase
MTTPEFITTPQGRKLAYHKTEGSGPGVIFLGGLKSDMTGTKAIYLEEWAKAQGRTYLRFDYSGHGQSSEEFTDGCIGDWAEDAQYAIETLTTGPQLLVGSSMGGWISLLMSKRIPERMMGLVTVAAAPDFTEDGFWAEFDDDQKQQVMEEGQVALPSEYGDPYIITRRMIEDGRNQLVMREPLELPFPVRMVQGTADNSVKTETALNLLNFATCDDIRLTLVRDKDHSFSDPECLALIEASINEVLVRAGAGM